jgi:hypothetical protein
MAVEIANFAGFSQAGMPVMVRGSKAKANKVKMKFNDMTPAVAVRARLCFQREGIMIAPLMLTMTTL